MAFTEGFGLETPIISGQCKIVRYYPYFDMALSTMKDIIITGRNNSLAEEMRMKIKSAKDCHELCHIMNENNFWVTVGCESIFHSPGDNLEGTRLTLQKKDPEGYIFSIRTPGTPSRY